MDTGDRSFYQILQIQPDASSEVVRHNYLILLQKLRIHPDLGGNNLEATLINLAYETLRDPKKRAEYDQFLLKKNGLLILSRTHSTRPPRFPKKTQGSFELSCKQNKRNYYRILQVHPDAHETVIRERYKSLLEKSGVPDDLLHEAYSVLSSAEKRNEYDRLLNCHTHAVAVNKMKAATDSLKKDLQYCSFCKTAHFYDPVNNLNKSLCSECDSPLFSSGLEMLKKSGRSIERIKRSEKLFFLISWPGQKFSGSLFDISPRGLRFSAQFKLDIGQIIKIEGENFKAVAEVIHRRDQGNISSNGVCFHTILFNNAKGNFVLTSA